MNRNLRAPLFLLTFVVAVGSTVLATTCVANEEFSVKAVCGEVTDTNGSPIPNADVELLDSHSFVLYRVPSNGGGHFNMPMVAKGEYVLRIKSAYFITAWQPIAVIKNNASCGKINTRAS
jgi:hypothetical protein